jgi:hypothetical protein
MLRNPAAELAWREGPAGIGLFLPGAAEVGGQRPGEQELGAGGHDDPRPAVCLLGGGTERMAASCGLIIAGASPGCAPANRLPVGRLHPHADRADLPDRQPVL